VLDSRDDGIPEENKLIPDLFLSLSMVFLLVDLSVFIY